MIIMGGTKDGMEDADEISRERRWRQCGIEPQMSEMRMIAIRGKIKAMRDRTKDGMDAIDADEDDC